MTSTSFDPVAFIERKRDGHRHARGELDAFVRALVNDELPDYQASAWLMAAWLQGLDSKETLWLTRAMLESGERLDLSFADRPRVDKHSTGGVGDKLSLPLAPLVAGFGVMVPMISGRGLGHTGGTLDKLESIPGYRVHLERSEWERTLLEVGCSLIGQSAQIAPADRRLYALRDVTGTVESIPLIVASILSKKLAASLDALVLDVKVGRGAFMKDQERARKLARALVDVAARFGVRATALLTDMNTPIGRTVGNALEVRESLDVLRGAGPADTRALTIELGAEMLRLAGVAETAGEARQKLADALASGVAYERFLRMVSAHGGDTRTLEDPSLLPTAPIQRAVLAPTAGTISAVDALELGLVALGLGAGRRHKEDAVDHAVGVELRATVGDTVSVGDALAIVHARTEDAADAACERTLNAFRVGARKVKRDDPVLGRVRAKRPGSERDED